MRALQAQHAEMGSLLLPAPAAAERRCSGPGRDSPPRPPAVAVGAGRVAPRGPRAALAATRRRRKRAPFVRGERKVGRNEPCPCGSGKKYKHCHGALSSVE